MCYKSILMNIDVDGPQPSLVSAAVDLAGRHEAKLTGLCAADVPLPVSGPESATLAVEIWQKMRDELQGQRFREVHVAFERLTSGFSRSEWRESLSIPTSALVEAARAADLIVMATPDEDAAGDNYRHGDPASVVLRAGRPLLLLGDLNERIETRKIVVAWKDTREARRAISDALPLLREANDVVVVTIAEEVNQALRDGLADVVTFLAAHGVHAETQLIEYEDEFAGLLNFIYGSNADLVVSGAYGHSRLREWAFGGVTRSLLTQTRLNRFMSN